MWGRTQASLPPPVTSLQCAHQLSLPCRPPLRAPAVGFATSLDRRVNLMDAATPCFLYHALTGRVNGRLYL